MKLLYIDCFSGVSGDMFLGALLHLGAPLSQVKAEIAQLDLSGWDLDAQAGQVQGISGIRARVKVEGAHPLSEGQVADGQTPKLISHTPLLPGMGLTRKSTWLKGHHLHPHPDDHTHLEGEHDHTHHTHPHHGHGQASHSHTTAHRPYGQIRGMLEESRLSPGVKERALKVFYRLAQAEGKIHGISPEDVEFHEVGSVDAIVDVVGVCAGLELLGIQQIRCAPLPMGRGFVDCAHGRFPLPAPAVLEMTQGIPVRSDPREGEWVTPTGAALVTALSSSFGDLPSMEMGGIGYGLGTRDGQGIPNVLRLVWGEVVETPLQQRHTSTDRVVVLETNLDDMSPQLFGPLLEQLLAAGALDASFTPIQMKKNRPGVLIQVITDESHRTSLIDILLRETTTLGVRFAEWSRVCVPRQFHTVLTSGGPVRVKVSGQAGDWPNLMPEFDDVLAAARAISVPAKLIQQEVMARARELGLTKIHGGDKS